MAHWQAALSNGVLLGAVLLTENILASCLERCSHLQWCNMHIEEKSRCCVSLLIAGEPVSVTLNQPENQSPNKLTVGEVMWSDALWDSTTNPFL